MLERTAHRLAILDVESDASIVVKGGWAAASLGFYQDDAGALFRLYGTLGLIVLAGAGLLALMTPFIRRLIEQREQGTQEAR